MNGIDGLMEAAICLQTPGWDGYNVPAIIWGTPGEGKSSAMRSLGFERFVALTASIYDPTDFGGIPVLSADRSVIHYAAPEWSIFEEGADGLLLIDDITTCSPATQNALLRLILERRVASIALPKSVRVIAAANNVDDLNGGGHALSKPLANRFVHINWKMTASGFANALEHDFAKVELPIIDHKVHAEMTKAWKLFYAAFLRRIPTAISSLPSEEDVFPESFASPRSIEYAVRLAAACDCLGLAPKIAGGSKQPAAKLIQQDSSTFSNLICGTIGSGVGISFLKFIRENDIPDPDDVLSGKVRMDFKKMRDDQIHFLFTALSASMMKHVGSDESYHAATMILLELIEQLDATSKIDTAYIAIRNLVKGAFLQKAVETSKRLNRLSEFHRASSTAFSDHSELSQLIAVLESPPERKKRARINS